MYGGNITGINFTGLASGIDTEAIIQKLIELQKRPLQRLMVRKSELSARMSAYDQFRGLVNNLQTAAGALSVKNAFNLIRANSSDTQVATVSASTDAQPGTYELRVSKLAQAHKIISGAHTSATAELGVSGQFMVNGKVIEVVASDTLTSIASKINAANAGVTASILNGDNGQVFLTLTANETGAGSRIQLADVGGYNILIPTLKLITYAEFVRNQQNNAALSERFRDSTTPLGTLFGMNNPTSGTIQINGVAVHIDFATDSLNTIANRINSAGIPGVTASVVSETVNGTTYYRLKIEGASALPTFTDNNNILKNLGILQNQYERELVQAQDAEFTVDGISFKRSKNQITDVIPGVTLTLLSADATNPKRATITLSRDYDGIKGSINNFINAYNSLVDFLKQNASFDKETLRSGVLFGDTTVSLIQDTLVRKITDVVRGLDGTLRALTQVGVQLGRDGKLTLDEGKLMEALSRDLNGVSRLFIANGYTTNPNIAFVSATDATRPSSSTGYEVVITQVATRATATASVAQTSASTVEERLTFSGRLFGNESYTLVIPAGSTIDDTIARINSDARLKNLVVASKDSNGRLVIQARNYGSASSFSVVSDQAASANNSGIGTTALEAQGQDVAGTINGEPATGQGQFLTGNSGNPNTAGLQIRVMATAPGVYGAVVFTRGVADQVRQYAKSVTDIVNGDLTLANNALRDQIQALDEQMQAIREEVSRREQSLRQQFARLERALSQMQAQSMRLSAMMSGIPIPRAA
ncbi:MAG: flagellar filament capping protein FliD [Armatimonadota bacterium]